MAKEKENIRRALEQLKYEVANELGITLEAINKYGTSKQIGTYAGPVGGEMVRRLVEEAQKQIAQNQNSK